MNVKLLRSSILIIGFTLASMPVKAQTLADQYDTTKTVSITGTVFRLQFASNSPFWMVIETKNATPGEQRWVVVGNTMEALRLAGWVFAPPPAGTVNIDEKITVTGYLPKKDSKTVKDLAAASPSIAEELKTARLVHGIEVTLPSGKKVEFGAR